MNQSFVTDRIESSSYNESDNNSNKEKKEKDVENAAEKPVILNKKEVMEALKDVSVFKSNLREMNNMEGLIACPVYIKKK